MSLINISGLSFAYDGSYDAIFENVSFQIDTSWKLGFVGRNGRGKTTFLRLLMGKHPYSGKISGAIGFEYFPFDVPDKSLKSADVVKNICPNAAEWQLLREFSLLKLAEDVLYRPFSTLSNGEQAKLLLATLFLKENSFLLIDEPTNHLDSAARAIVSAYLNSKSGYILVSHDRAFLDACVTHILSINKTNIEVQKGNFTSWYENKERQDRHEQAESERLMKDVKRLRQAARQSGQWADKAEKSKIGGKEEKDKALNHRSYMGEKSRKMQQQRKNIENRQQKAIEEKSALLKNIETADALKISQLSYSKNILLQLENVSISYGEKSACKNVSFAIEQGERLALCGKNGSGKSSILKLICGDTLEFTGVFLLGSGLKVSYVSQDTSFLHGNLSDFAHEKNIDESLFKAILRKLDFERVQFEKDMQHFSAGQKKKVLIARSLCEQAHLYVWDEPLNFVDVLSRIQIEKLILEHKPTLLFVEHDETFKNKIATKMLDLG